MRFFNFLCIFILVVMLFPVVRAQGNGDKNPNAASPDDDFPIEQLQKNRANLKSIEAVSGEAQPEVYATKGFFLGIDYRKAEQSITRLNYAEKDAKDINSFFTKNKLYNFVSPVILEGEQVNRRNIIGELGKFKEELQNDVYPELHRVLIYFAGHGLIHDNRYYLALNSTEFSMPRGESISKTEIYEEISDICKLNPNLEIFLIVDACYSGNLLFTPRVEDQRNITTLLSSEFGGLSYEDYNRGNGIYTRFFLTGAKGAAAGDDDVISVREAGNFANENVIRETDEKQIPVYASFSQSIPIAIKRPPMLASKVIPPLVNKSRNSVPLTLGFTNNLLLEKDTVPKLSIDTFGLLLNQIELYRNRFIRDPFQLPNPFELEEVMNNLTMVMASEEDFFRDEKRLKSDSFFFAGLNKLYPVLTFWHKLVSFDSNIVKNATIDFKNAQVLFSENLGAAILEVQCLTLLDRTNRAIYKINSLISEYPDYPNSYAIKALIHHIENTESAEAITEISNFINSIEKIINNYPSTHKTIGKYISIYQLRIIDLISPYNYKKDELALSLSNLSGLFVEGKSLNTYFQSRDYLSKIADSMSMIRSQSKTKPLETKNGNEIKRYKAFWTIWSKYHSSGIQIVNTQSSDKDLSTKNKNLKNINVQIVTEDSKSISGKKYKKMCNWIKKNIVIQATSSLLWLQEIEGIHKFDLKIEEEENPISNFSLSVNLINNADTIGFLRLIRDLNYEFGREYKYSTQVEIDEDLTSIHFILNRRSRPFLRQKNK